MSEVYVRLFQIGINSLTFRYIITRDGGSYPQTVSHDTNPNSNRITTTWSGLSPGVVYTFTVQCKIQGEDCQGDPSKFTASTTPCLSKLYYIS